MKLNINTSRIKARFARAIDRLERAWDENPIAVIGIFAVASAGSAKLLTALTNARNSSTWRREVRRRERMK